MRGIPSVVFSGDESLPVIVTAAAFRKFVVRGGVAVFLWPPALRMSPAGRPIAKPSPNPLLRTGLFPIGMVCVPPEVIGLR